MPVLLAAQRSRHEPFMSQQRAKTAPNLTEHYLIDKENIMASLFGMSAAATRHGSSLTMTARAAQFWRSSRVGIHRSSPAAAAATRATQLRLAQKEYSYTNHINRFHSNGYSTLLITTEKTTRKSIWPSLLQSRHYTPMTKQEEESEKRRVAGLSDFAKDQELRKLNREISYLELKKGILTGEAYTWSGKYKALARDYGMPLFVWYWTVWFSTAILCYGAIGIFDIDVMAILAQLDGYTGWSLTSKVDPQMGKIGMALVANEALEPVRLPAVIVTVKPVMDRIFPPKY